MKIKSIDINAFRGIPRKNLDLQGKSLLLQGENGTGKSSIVDAIEFFFTGKISHLPSNKLSYLKNYACHVNFKSEDLKISMDFDPGAIHVKRIINSISIPPSIETEFKTAQKGGFILRRSQILQFINNTPGERYKFIGEILNIAKLEKTEKEMINARKKLQEDFDGINEKLEKNKEDLRRILGENIQKSGVLQSLNELLKNEGMDTINSINEIENYAIELVQTVKITDQNNINALNDICDKIDGIHSTTGYITGKLSSAEDLKSDLINMHGREDLSLLGLLKKSKEIINENSEKCPLCKNKVSGTELLESIDKRLTGLKTLESKNNELKGSINDIDEKINSLNSDLNSILSKIDLFEELIKFKGELTVELDILDIFLKNINFQSFLEGKISKYDYENFKDNLEIILTPLKESSEGLKGSLKPSQKDEKLLKISNLFFEVDKNIKESNELDEKLGVSRTSLKIAEKIVSTFSEVKKKKIQEVYDTIEEDLERFYKILHPKDLHENINLDLDKNRRASTNLKMTIFGRNDEDPRALSSEGHLDSLGLCIFLSIFKKFNSDFPLLVLDDVVTTVDSRHRENICKLLFEEFGDKQFIITTHDAIWFKQLRAAQRVYNLGNRFKNCTIISWDLEGGPEIRPYKLRWEKIEEDLKNGNKNCAGNEGRSYLEWLLVDICNRTMARIPAKYSGKYEVDDLISPARSRLNKLIKNEEYKKRVENCFKDLEKTMIMGNLLSHNNLMAGNVSNDEVEHFCNSVHEIHKLMTCPNCKAPLKYYRDLKILRCSNEKCKGPLEIKTK